MKTFAITAAGLLACTAAANAAVINGDFETGDISPAVSAYTLDGTMFPPATYNVVGFDTIHPSWVDFFDHTRGNSDGHFMIVNGTDSGAGPVWAQVISVTPGTSYEMSAWFASLFPAAVASLSLRVYGLVERGDSPIAALDFIAPSDLGVWAQQTLAFDAGQLSAVRVEIWDTNAAFSGNDYAIDDIAVSAVPAPGAAAMLGLAGITGVRRRR